MIRRILDWLIGRREPDTHRLDDIEQRLQVLGMRVAVRRGPR